MRKLLLSICSMICIATIQLKAAHEVAVWVPWFDGASTYNNLTSAHGGVYPKDVFNTVCLQFWEVSGGSVNLGPDPSPFVSWAQQNNIKSLLTVFNGTSGWDWDVAYQAFRNAESFSNTLISQMDAYQLDGIDIDLEGDDVSAIDQYRDEFKTFINTLSGKLKPRGKLLTVCIFADANDPNGLNNYPNSAWIGDWAGKVDYIHVMLYQEGGDASLPGSVGQDEQYYYSFQQEEGIKAGYSATQISMGLPAWDADTWNNNWSAHFDQLLAINASVCVWDSKFSNGSWAGSSDLWKKLAKFKAQVPNYRLTINKGPGGTVSTDPAGPDFPQNTQVTLTATPGEGFTFAGWGGDASGTQSTVKVTMTGDKSVTATFTPKNTGEGFDMLAEGSWDSYKDDFGSNITTTKNTSSVANSWTLAKMPDGETYPWIGLAATADAGSYEGLTSVTITYTSSTPLLISLTDPTLSDYGECFQYSLPASSSEKTIAIAKTDFKQPSWAEHKMPEVNLKAITSIDFAPDVAVTETAGANGDFTITGLKVIGTTLRSETSVRWTAITTASSTLPRITATGTGLKFSKLREVSGITVFDAAGRILARQQTRASSAHVPLVKSRGIVLVSIQKTDGTALVQRIVR